MVFGGDFKLNPNAKIKIIFNNSIFGPGVIEIMELVQKKGSLSQAYRDMNLSASKGWRIIKKTEEELGYPLFATIVGGQNGGGSCLTKQGADLLRRYKAFAGELTAETERLYEKHFS